MTTEESITVLTQMKRDTEIRDFQAEALDLAISALQEKADNELPSLDRIIYEERSDRE